MTAPLPPSFDARIAEIAREAAESAPQHFTRNGAVLPENVEKACAAVARRVLAEWREQHPEPKWVEFGSREMERLIALDWSECVYKPEGRKILLCPPVPPPLPPEET